MKRIFRTVAFALALGAMSASFVACEEEEGTGIEDSAIDEVVDCSGLKITANTDGTITISGKVESNAKIKEFCLYGQDGTTVKYDFLKDNEQVKEKNDAIDENGKVTTTKVFSLDNIETTVPVDLYTLSIKTKDTKKPVSEKLGEVLEYTIGTGKSTTSSYLSVKENKSYNLEGASAKDVVATVEVIAHGTDKVEGIKRASEAKSADINANCGKVALFDENGKAVAKGDDTNPGFIGVGGVIITESGCICKIVEIGETDANTFDAKFKGITIKSTKSLTVSSDVKEFSK